jgi:hypothetical protein
MMPPPKFKESTKLEARKLSGFRCVWCKISLGIDVHHIDQEGDNDIDNAIVVCPGCHRIFLHNELYTKKFIKQVRDAWYDTVKSGIPLSEKVLGDVEVLNKKVEEHTATIEDIKKAVVGMSSQLKLINTALDKGDINTASKNLNSLQSSATFTNIATYVMAGSTAPPKNCPICGYKITDPNEIDCPKCHFPCNYDLNLL